jgi:hypothetical protein
LLCYLDFIAEFFAPYALASFPCIRGVSRLYNEALNSPKRYGTLIERMDDKTVFLVIHSVADTDPQKGLMFLSLYSVRQ